MYCLDVVVQDGIETVDSSYEVFLQEGLEDFKQYAFKLKTTAAKYLGPKRIKEYITIIYREQGVEMAQVKTTIYNFHTCPPCRSLWSTLWLSSASF